MYEDKKVKVIIVAAGEGKRMKLGLPKQFLYINGLPMFIHTYKTFANDELVDEIYISINKEFYDEYVKYINQYLNEKEKNKLVALVNGGKERQDSVFNTLAYIDGNITDCKNAMNEGAITSNIVLVHDAARTFVTQKIIDDVIESTFENDVAIPCVPVKDTIRTKNKTLNRKELYQVQTPQGFRHDIIWDIHRRVNNMRISATDDASLAEIFGIKIHMVEGSYENIKITTKEDLQYVNTDATDKTKNYDNKTTHIFGKNEIDCIYTGNGAASQKNIDSTNTIITNDLYNTQKKLLRNILQGLRIGTGYDVHRLVYGGKCIMGGVEIPFEKGLDGHSDADVLVHAIMDALLGAAGLGDIGKLFPDTDVTYKNIDSLKLLAKVHEILKKHGYSIINIDATVIAQAPKLAPYIEQMKENISKVLQITENPTTINIKATTTERLGFTGRKEGIAAEAVCLLSK